MKIVFENKELKKFIKRLDNTTKFEKCCKEITRELAKVLHQMLLKYTPVKTGKLRAAWNEKSNLSYEIKRTDTGFEITLVNSAENKKGDKYGIWVNDGHRSFNQFGGPYGFVKGKFFVEKSIVATEAKANEIIYKELVKWFRWCCGG